MGVFNIQQTLWCTGTSDSSCQHRVQRLHIYLFISLGRPAVVLTQNTPTWTCSCTTT